MTSDEMNSDIFEICQLCRVMPILVIDELECAVPLAEALVAGGIKVMEITLRTPVALEAISRIRNEVPDIIIGAGTVLTPKDVENAHTSGAQFGVSPGTTDELMNAVDDIDLPFLPGVSTPSEMMYAMEREFLAQKFFPATQNGGVEMLKATFGPLPQIFFCPTGGIGKDAVSDYLDLPNVMCVGGSWVAPKNAIRERNWDEIKNQAKIASGF